MAGANTNNVESTSRQDSSLTTNKRGAKKPTKFTLFPKPPIELRYKIWSLALPDARVIELLWNSKHDKCYTDAPQPAILRFNQESRGEALRFYDAWVIHKVWEPPALTSSRMTRSASAEEKKYEEELSNLSLPILFATYINFATDTVYFSSRHLNHLERAEAFHSFRNSILYELLRSPYKIDKVAFNGERRARNLNGELLSYLDLLLTWLLFARFESFSMLSMMTAVAQIA